MNSLGTVTRRTFLSGCVAVVAAPLVAGAQPGKVPRIGVLLGLATPEHAKAGVREGLRVLGYLEDQNILVEYRFAVGQMDRLTELAADLVRLKVAIIVADGTLATQAARRATAGSCWN